MLNGRLARGGLVAVGALHRRDVAVLEVVLQPLRLVRAALVVQDVDHGALADVKADELEVARVALLVVVAWVVTTAVSYGAIGR